MTFFKRLDAALGWIYDLIGSLAGIVIGLFAIAIPLDLVLRLFKIGNLPGMQEVIEYVLFACVFLAAPWALRLGAHIRVDVLIRALPTARAKVVDRLLNLLGFVICAALAWYGFRNLIQAYTFNSTQRKYFDVPEWWLLTAFVICFLLLAVEFFSRILRGGASQETKSEHEGGF
ncbi:MAG: TRAP transporter small permease [Hyphomicrobiaceae bacterium]